MGAVALLRLFRVPLVFTAVADSATGFLLAASGKAGGTALLLLAASSGGLYCFGMAMNDLADLERDRVLHPKRVLPSGRLSSRRAWGASLGVLGLSAAAIVLVPGPLTRLALWMALVFLILVYDWFLKWPPVMGMIRAFNLLLGFSCGAGTGPSVRSGMLGVTFLFLYVTALTFASTYEEGEPKRKGAAAAILTMGLAALGLPFAFAAGTGSPLRPAALAVAGVLAGWVLFRGLEVRRKGREALPRLVRDGVAGILFLDAAMLLSCGHLVPGLAVAALLVPAAAGVWGLKRLG